MASAALTIQIFPSGAIASDGSLAILLPNGVFALGSAVGAEVVTGLNCALRPSVVNGTYVLLQRVASGGGESSVACTSSPGNGAAVTVRVTALTLSNVTVALGSMEVAVRSGTGVVVARNSSLPVTPPSLSAVEIAYTAATVTNATASALGTVRVEFRRERWLPTGGRATIVLPANFTLASGDALSGSASSDLVGDAKDATSAFTRVSDRVLRVTRPSGAGNAAPALSFLQVERVLLPAEFGTTGSFGVTVDGGADSSVIETGSASGVVIDPPPMPFAEIATSNTNASATATLTIRFAAGVTLPADGVFNVTFPSGAGFSVSTLASAKALESIDGLFTVSFSNANGIATVRRSAYGTPAPANVSCGGAAVAVTLSPVTLPSSSGPTGSFRVRIGTAAGALLAQSALLDGFNVTPACDPAGGFYSLNGECYACASGCASCAIGAPSNCTTCVVGARPSQAATPFSCVAGGCPANCAVCGASKCTTCSSGYYLDSEGTCSACASGCAACTGAGAAQCTSCSAGWYRDAANASQPCQQCDVSCAACSGAGAHACTQCSTSGSAPLLLRAGGSGPTATGACVSACPSGTYSDSVAGVCRCAPEPRSCYGGPCCTGEAPTGGSFRAAGVVCRAAAGDCDVAEVCTGTAATCPSDAVRPATHVCRPANGSCDTPELCSGRSTACPTDSFVSAGTTCRTSLGQCDPAEQCSGSGASCPTDARTATGTACGPSGVDATCNATVGLCTSSGTPSCGNGVVEAGEQCDGGGCCTSSCTLAAAGTVCRGAAGACDVAEVCSGTSAACPVDAFRSAGTVCRESAAPCDAAEACDGSAAACPTDAAAANGTVCSVFQGSTAGTCSGTDRARCDCAAGFRDVAAEAALSSGGGIAAEARCEPVPVSAVADAPSSADTCVGFAVSALASSGNADAPWASVSWSVSYTGDATLSQFASLRAAVEQETTLRVTLAPDLLVAGENYTVSVTLSNIGGASGTASSTVFILSAPAPTAAIRARSTATVARSTALVLPTAVELSPCYTGVQEVDFTWSIFATASGAAASLPSSVSLSSATLSVPGGTLLPGVAYTVRCVVCYRGTTNCAAAQVARSIARAVPRARLAGLSSSAITVQSGETVVLDARASFDPDDGASTSSLVYRFTCAVAGSGAACQNTSGSTLTFADAPLAVAASGTTSVGTTAPVNVTSHARVQNITDTLVPGTKYIFRATVSNPVRDGWQIATDAPVAGASGSAERRVLVVATATSGTSSRTSARHAYAEHGASAVAASTGVPQLTIDPLQASVISAGSTVRFFTSCTLNSAPCASAAGAAYSWRISAGDKTLAQFALAGQVLTTTTSGSSLVLGPNPEFLPGSSGYAAPFTPGNAYEVEVAFSATGAPRVEASVAFAVNRAPRGGRLAVSPTTGVALETEFRLVAEEWSDETEELTFKFYDAGVLSSGASAADVAEAVAGAATLAGDAVSAAERTVLLSPGVRSLFVVAIDEHGASTASAFVTVTVAEKDAAARGGASTGTYVERTVLGTNGAYDNATRAGDTARGLAVLTKAAEWAAEDSNSTAAGEAGSAVLERADSLSSGNSSSAGRSEQLAGVYRAVAELSGGEGQGELRQGVASRTASETSALRASNTVPERPATYVGALGAVAARSNTSNSTEAQAIVDSIEQSLGDLAQLRAAGRAANEQADDVRTPNLTASFGAYATNGTGSGGSGVNVNVSMTDGAARGQAQFSVDGVTLSGSGFAGDGTFSAAQFRNDPYPAVENQTVRSVVATLTLYNSSGSALPLRNLSAPINITLPHKDGVAPGDGSSCAAFDEGAGNWSVSGCVVVSITADATICACNHTTAYGVIPTPTFLAPDDFSNLSRISEDPGFAVPVAIIALLIAFACTVALIYARRDAREWRAMFAESAGDEEQRQPLQDLRRGAGEWKLVKREHPLLSSFYGGGLHTRPQIAILLADAWMGAMLLEAVFVSENDADETTGAGIAISIFIGILTIIVVVPLTLVIRSLFTRAWEHQRNILYAFVAVHQSTTDRPLVDDHILERLFPELPPDSRRNRFMRRFRDVALAGLLGVEAAAAVAASGAVESTAPSQPRDAKQRSDAAKDAGDSAASAPGSDAGGGIELQPLHGASAGHGTRIADQLPARRSSEGDEDQAGDSSDHAVSRWTHGAEHDDDAEAGPHRTISARTEPGALGDAVRSPAANGRDGQRPAISAPPAAAADDDSAFSFIPHLRALIGLQAEESQGARRNPIALRPLAMDMPRRRVAGPGSSPRSGEVGTAGVLRPSAEDDCMASGDAGDSGGSGPAAASPGSAGRAPLAAALSHAAGDDETMSESAYGSQADASATIGRYAAPPARRARRSTAVLSRNSLALAVASSQPQGRRQSVAPVGVVARESDADDAKASSEDWGPVHANQDMDGAIRKSSVYSYARDDYIREADALGIKLTEEDVDKFEQSALLMFKRHFKVAGRLPADRGEMELFIAVHSAAHIMHDAGIYEEKDFRLERTWHLWLAWTVAILWLLVAALLTLVYVVTVFETSAEATEFVVAATAGIAFDVFIFSPLRAFVFPKWGEWLEKKFGGFRAAEHRVCLPFVYTYRFVRKLIVKMTSLL